MSLFYPKLKTSPGKQVLKCSRALVLQLPSCAWNEGGKVRGHKKVGKARCRQLGDHGLLGGRLRSGGSDREDCTRRFKGV